jgi:hypothetical protein
MDQERTELASEMLNALIDFGISSVKPKPWDSQETPGISPEAEKALTDFLRTTFLPSVLAVGSAIFRDQDSWENVVRIEIPRFIQRFFGPGVEREKSTSSAVGSFESTLETLYR